MSHATALCPRLIRSQPRAVLDRSEGHKVPASRARRRVRRGLALKPSVRGHDERCLLGYRAPSSQPIAYLVVSVKALRKLQQLNLVAYPDRAVFYYPRADTTATL